MSNRISRLFSRRRDEDRSAEQSIVTSSGCEVPIFMSQPSNDPQTESRTPHFGEIRASWTEFNNPADERRLTIPCSSVYTQSPGQQHDPRHEYEAEDDSPRSPASVEDLEDGTAIISTTASEAPVLRGKRRKSRRPRESLRQRIAAKKRLGVAFGVTALATVITCK